MRYSRTIDERRGIIGFVVPMNVGRALESGKALVNATFGKNGAEFWVQPLDPEFSHKTMGLEDAEEFYSSGRPHTPIMLKSVVGGRVPSIPEGTSLDNDTFVGRVTGHIGKNPMKKVVLPESWEDSFSSDNEDGTIVSEKIGEKGTVGHSGAVNSLTNELSSLKIEELVRSKSTKIPTASSENQAKAMAASELEAGFPFASMMDSGRAAGLVKSGNLDRNRKQGVLNLFPSQSLVKEDFKKTLLEHFQARVVCVANAISSAKMVSRIASDPRFKIPGCQNLADWWLAAGEEQRFLAVTQAKHCSSDVDKRRLLLLPCPFQDAGLD